MFISTILHHHHHYNPHIIVVLFREIDVLAFLQWMGAGEKVISAFGNPAYGNLAVAYLLYKVCTVKVVCISTCCTVNIMCVYQPVVQLH